MSVEGKKSLKLNMVLNMLRGLLGAVFPLITFPYVSRILGVNNIGMFNFSNSIISYFVLLAGLGINTYAVREGAPIREDKKQLGRFVNQIFSINIISMIGSYILLFLVILLVPKLRSYTMLLLILSSQIAFKTIGIEWLYTIYEEYAYITIRTIFFQFVSLIMMFLLVKKPSDVLMYAIATVIATVGSNFMNYIYARKFCHISFTTNINWKKHIKPIMILFATSATVTIYVSSDTTILGLICGDYEVGIYSVSIKVYTLLKTVLSSAIVVSIPRMAKYAGEEKWQEFGLLGNDIYNTFITFIFPTIIGMILLRRQIVQIISGQEYIRATSSLALLCIAIFFCLGAGFWSQAVMIPLNMENKVFFITAVSAMVNIILNMILIPFGQEIAAALTTITAEGLVFIYCRYQSKKYIYMKSVGKTILKSFLGCLPMVLVSYSVNKMIKNHFISTFFIIIFCVLVYIIIELFLKNEIILGYYYSIKEHLRKNNYRG